jgi:hypothetical protein
MGPVTGLFSYRSNYCFHLYDGRWAQAIQPGVDLLLDRASMAPMHRDIAEAKLMALGAGAKLARQRLG